MNLNFLSLVVRMTAVEVLNGGRPEIGDRFGIELQVSDVDGSIVVIASDGTGGYQTGTIELDELLDPEMREPEILALLEA